MNAGSSEVRLDVLTGRHVILVPGRSARPGSQHRDPMLQTESDPFAEGCESETPDECFAVRPGATPPNSPGWLLRVVPNRYPIAAPLDAVNPALNSGPASECGHALFPTTALTGRHEVVIECPDNRSRLLDLSPAELQRILSAWRARSRALIAEGHYRTLAIYRNEGFSAGASLPHCHSQILAACRLSQLDHTRLERADAYFREHHRELLPDLMQAEEQSGARIVTMSDRLTVLCPFAPRSAWHVRFVPRPPRPAFFSAADDHIVEELADLIPKVLQAIEASCGGQIPMNIVLSQPPVDRPAAWSWMLELLPRLTKQAGWELLTDEDTFPGQPEAWAAAVRLRLNLAAG